MMQKVAKPQIRGALRKFLGREYFILKRRFNWFYLRKNFATVDCINSLPYSYIKHQSFFKPSQSKVFLQF